MGSSCKYKIPSSMIKPARESLLDYCSYSLLLIAFVGILRVLIGSSSLRYDCWDSLNEFGTERIDNKYNGFYPTMENSGHELLLGDLQRVLPSQMTIKTAVQNDFVWEGYTKIGESNSTELVTGSRKATFMKEPRGTTVAEPKEKDETSPYDDLNGTTKNEMNWCPKYYQSLFAYILLVESILLLFAGMLWTKVPRVSLTLRTFTDLVQTCRNSDWAGKTLRTIMNRSTNPDVSNSLYSIMSSDNNNYDMRLLLDTLFHPDSEYHAKAKARHLYEKVQTFCLKHNEARDLWSTYIFKSVGQLVLWIIIFHVNFALFVQMQFYIACSNELNAICNHDEFLRIIWFMAQIVLLIYGVFNFKNLKWINEKAIVTRRLCNCCSWMFFDNHKILDQSNKVPRVVCKLYRYGCNQPVLNDMALLMHLLQESHPKILPYLVVFMFEEWKDKLTSFATTVQISEFPIRSSMQMLSGRPPPIIEVTDVTSGLQSPPIAQWRPTSKPQPGTSRPKHSVTFYFETESGGGSESESKTSPEHHSRSTGSPSSVEIIPPLSLPHHRRNLSDIVVDIPSPPLVNEDPGEVKSVKSSNPILKLNYKESHDEQKEFLSSSGKLMQSDEDGSETDENTSLLHDVRESFLESMSGSSKSDSESNTSKTLLVENNI